MRRGRTTTSDNLIHAQILIGFSLTLPDEIAFEDTIVRDFLGNIIGSRVITHIVKFEDPMLQLELSRLARTIFVIEMKLRRVLTIIYLNAYKEDDPYQLLKDESLNPHINPRAMLVASENEFFHLTFDQYSRLNDRPDPELSDILEFFRTSDSSHYDDFRAEILRIPIENEADAELLSDLHDLVRPIQTMRNCVAHNRRPPERLSANFPTAYSQLSRWPKLMFTVSNGLSLPGDRATYLSIVQADNDKATFTVS